MHSLSYAGRTLLVKSVISSRPIYTMQTSLLPATITADIEKRIMNFIWGEGEKRRMHLINWSTITQPKNRGGLGVQELRRVNRAMLAKTCWRFLKQQDAIWVKVLRGSMSSAAEKSSRSKVEVYNHIPGRAYWKGLNY